MSTALDELLDSIHPQRTLEAVEKRADEAINTFAAPGGEIVDWDAFRACLIGFLQHLDICLLCLFEPCPMDVDFAWGRCTQILMRLYGRSGEKAAFEMARTGNDGGLYAVLKAMARRLAEHYAESEILARIHTYWNALSPEAQIAAGDEYVRKHGHLLPSELTEGSATRVLADLPTVLSEHPRLIQRLRRVGRSGPLAEGLQHRYGW